MFRRDENEFIMEIED
jgi:hypothetical protein